MRNILLALSLAFPLASQAGSSITCTGDMTITGGDVISLSCSGDLYLRDDIFTAPYVLQADGGINIEDSRVREWGNVTVYQIEGDRGTRPTLNDSAAINLGGDIRLVSSGANGSGLVVQVFDDTYPGGGSLVVGWVRLIQTGVLVNPGAGIIISSVPEPSTYSAMLVGLMTLGWVSRRRRKI